MKVSNGLFLCVFLIVACHEKKVSLNQVNDESISEKLDYHVERLITEGKIPAISLAVFSPEEIKYHRSFGVKGNAIRQPIDSASAFEAASLSKTVFAYLVMKLVVAGEIDLDQPLDSIALIDLGLDDKRRAIISPRMILAHQAGLPNWRGKFEFSAKDYQDLFSGGEKLYFLDTPGTGFHYSGEGYLWLQRVLEKKWQIDLNEYANRHLFDPLKLYSTSFLFDDRVKNKAVRGHLKYQDTTARMQFHIPIAAGSLHSNALEFSRFFQYLIAETERSEVMAEMFQPQVLADHHSDYTVYWGLGVGIIKFKGKSYLFHWGDNRIFKAYYLYSLDEKKGLVFFVNCQEGLRLQPDLVELVFGEKIPMWPEDYFE